ncbi:cytochrome d ubiquinol oxidase subunit II [Saccharomonospora sp. NPDC046836]|uniref:cytochrome d ubiquinol oxidase subunit II n=1 Tax=Saccharomonospora sp. NPDC046836 TaxID=3156921 RepID=UPI0033C1FA3F
MIADVIAGVLLAAVAGYACGGGVDFGAGFWDLVAGGSERGERPRWLIDHAMEPVWETNNVWLIFVLVIMWTGFPVLFQTLFSAMWLPLVLAAVGLVLRGAGFALRKQMRRLARRRAYGALFAVSSLLTPFFLGAAVGGLATGRVAPGTTASADAWSNGTSVITGLLTIAATAFLGAVFLTADARRFDAPDLAGYFRRRAWYSLAVILVLAVIGLAVTRDDARYVYNGLTSGIGLALVLVAVVSALATAGLLYRMETAWARFTAVGSVALVVVAWGLAQRPYLIPTSLTVDQAAGASTTLNWLVLVTIIAVVLVVPPLVLLYRLDTRGALQPLTDADLRENGEGARRGGDR